MTRSFQVRIRILSRGRIPLLSLNEFGEKSRVTIILGKFVNKQNQTLIGLNFLGKVYRWSKLKAYSDNDVQKTCCFFFPKPPYE